MMDHVQQRAVETRATVYHSGTHKGVHVSCSFFLLFVSGLSFEVHDDSSVELEGGEHNKFSVWVSFAEIYNEFIYDLLTEAPAKGKQRPALKLAEDKNRNHFIKGMFKWCWSEKWLSSR